MPAPPRRTKILATVGPASSTPEMLETLVHAGADAFRLNFSHGTHKQHEDMVARIREVSERVGKAIPLVQDIQGPKIRVGGIPEGRMTLTNGQEVTLQNAESTTEPGVIPITYDYLAQDVRPGDSVLMDDGYLEVRVESVARNAVKARVVTGGLLKTNKGVNFPGVRLSIKFPTEKDKVDLVFGQEMGVDFVAASFVRSAADIARVRAELDDDVGSRVIAKIELREALDNLDEIVRSSDGVLVARGDLGVELPVEDVPIVQKELIRLANVHGIPVITATQMLESMIENPRPTRAEATDVANAIMDGTDGLMLSAETAAGKHPEAAVRFMATIASRTERAIAERFFAEGPRRIASSLVHTRETPADAIAHATTQAAHDSGARVIVTLTETGSTAGLVAKYRPRVPILALTPRARTERQLQLRWGVVPLHVPIAEDFPSLRRSVREAVLQSGLAEDVDVIALTSGRLGVAGGTNILEVCRVKDLDPDA